MTSKLVPGTVLGALTLCVCEAFLPATAELSVRKAATVLLACFHSTTSAPVGSPGSAHSRLETADR